MYLVKKQIVFILILFSCCTALFAKDDYRAEVGFNVGVASYLGDANSTPFNNSVPDYAILFRLRHNKRWASRAEFSFAEIKIEKQPIILKNKVNRLDFCGEFNFFDFEKNEHAAKSRTYSPYIFMGLGAMDYCYMGKRRLSLSVPFGVGLRVRINKRINFNLQFANSVLLADNLEGVKRLNNPHELNGSNFMKNDAISSLTVGLTISFWKKDCRCVVLND